MKKRILTFLVITVSILGGIFYFARHTQPFRFIALDIGQGDALFLETPKGKQILIDGGPSNTVLEQLGKAMPLFDRTIDDIIVTHPDSDHITGLIAVVRRYHVKRMLMTGIMHHTATYDLLNKEIRLHNIPVTYVQAGATFPFDSTAHLDILAPLQSWQGKDTQDTNDTSIVATMAYKNFSVLLTGDAPFIVEEAMVRAHEDVHATILKIGHHGSKLSSSAAFLAAVHPRAAIISVGAKNTFGHPTPEVLNRLSVQHIPAYRTDQLGAILVQSDGTKYSITNKLPFRLW